MSTNSKDLRLRMGVQEVRKYLEEQDVLMVLDEKKTGF